mmetsp:Transcript_22256/g.50963  ORF Transcript_22256/g.50963 Transcript_22256/m.50963 type:complete len:192 (-) Transcript_22256:230-805(-)
MFSFHGIATPAANAVLPSLPWSDAKEPRAQSPASTENSCTGEPFGSTRHRRESKSLALDRRLNPWTLRILTPVVSTDILLFARAYFSLAPHVHLFPDLMFLYIASGLSQVKLYVGNLNYDTTVETVREAFEAQGSVSDVYFPLDRDTGSPRGFCFITMPADEALIAANALNGSNMDGRTIRVTESRPKPQY